MPLYEYVCKEDGAVLELIRPMAEADAPVDDPEGLGRTFQRKQSTFTSTAPETPFSLPTGSGCGCGNPNGPCARG